MANADTPRGFRPVKHFNGSAWNGQLFKFNIVDGTDIGIGDALTLSNGSVTPASTTEDVVGVAMAFGRNSFDGLMGGGSDSFNPANLESPRYYDDSANTHSEWVCLVALANDTLFDVQSASDLDLSVGSTAQLGGTTVNTTTGISRVELAAAGNNDVTVVEIPDDGKQDSTLANTVYHVLFNNIALGVD